MSWIDIQEYESLRVKEAAATLRFGSGPKHVASGPGQTIMLSQREGTPYVCFRIVERGIEFSLGNIAVAIPKGVPSLRQKTVEAAPAKKLAPNKKLPKNVKRRVPSENGDVVVQPRRRGPAKSIVSPVPGVDDGED